MKPHIQNELKMKQKIEKDKETVRPTVINDRLIGEYMVEYNRENKIFDDDDRKIWEFHATEDDVWQAFDSNRVITTSLVLCALRHVIKTMPAEPNKLLVDEE